MVLLLSFEEVYQDSLTKRSKITEIGISQKVVEYLSDQKLDRFSGKPLPLRSTSQTFDSQFKKLIIISSSACQLREKDAYIVTRGSLHSKIASLRVFFRKDRNSARMYQLGRVERLE
jgi:hypothetical protein